MDRDTKRWIFDITAWIAGLLAIIMLIADAAASDRMAPRTRQHQSRLNVQVAKFSCLETELAHEEREGYPWQASPRSCSGH